MFSISYAEGVADDLAKMRPFDRRRLLDRIEEQLRHQPTAETRNKKQLPGLIPPWEHEPPVWELRIGENRVFYDVNEAECCVIVRAVRRKPPHATTEEVL
jgi:mRNA-degrading endonuclease RelE of RelBE toxin-antitoxin system